MPPNESRRLALSHLDRALADKPEKNGHELSAALRCLATTRDEMIMALREAPDEVLKVQLGHVNAVISSVMAAQYPLGEVPWDELARARGWLDALAESEA